MTIFHHDQRNLVISTDSKQMDSKHDLGKIDFPNSFSLGKALSEQMSVVF